VDIVTVAGGYQDGEQQKQGPGERYADARGGVRCYEDEVDYPHGTEGAAADGQPIEDDTSSHRCRGVCDSREGEDRAEGGADQGEQLRPVFHDALPELGRVVVNGDVSLRPLTFPQTFEQPLDHRL
jgi:hypothetical protein